MDRVITLLLALALAAAGALAWDRLPPVGFTIPIPIWRPHVGLPPSLQQRLDAAQAASLGYRAAARQCTVQLQQAGAGQERLAAADKAALDAARAQVQANAHMAATWQASAAQLRASAAGWTKTDNCAAWEAADAAVRQALGR